MKITATLRRDGKDLQRAALKYAGEVSHFTVDLPPVTAGAYTLRVVASNPKTINFAMYEADVTVR